MAQGTCPPRGRQARRRGRLVDGEPIALARLFSLHPEGRITAAHLAPVRACLVAARLALDALRFAAEDAVDLEPLMPREAQYEDVHARGADVDQALYAAQEELDLLAQHLRREVARVS